MNSSAMTRFTQAVMIVAVLATIVIVLPVNAHTSAPTTDVVTLPRVEVVGKRVADAPQASRTSPTGLLPKSARPK